MPTSHSSLRPPEYHERDVVTEWPREPRPSVVNNEYSTVKRRSTGKRIVRALARFFIAVLIGAGATLAWQSYGDAAMKMVRTEAPSLAWLLPVSAATPPVDQGSTAAAASSPQLERLELSLLMVRRGVDQLAAMVEQLSAKQDQLAVKQDQMSHIAILKSVEPPPQSRAIHPRKPPQPPTAQSSATQSLSVPAPPPPTEQPLR
jgi:hypothetical protein